VSTKKPHIFGTLTGYAYETVPGKSIVAGQTKGTEASSIGAPNASLIAPTSQPTTLAMLALGSPALFLRRRDTSTGASR